VRSHEAVVRVRDAVEAGHILHATDDEGFPFTAGRTAVPGRDPAWVIFKYHRPGAGLGGGPIIEDDCGSPSGLARVLVRTYIGPVRALEAVARAGG
jgi:hypothetical protein